MLKKTQCTNPFLGTFLFVWLYRNWELVCNLFNFDDNSKRVDKIAILKSHFQDENMLKHFATNVIVCFVGPALGTPSERND